MYVIVIAFVLIPLLTFAPLSSNEDLIGVTIRFPEAVDSGVAIGIKVVNNTGGEDKFAVAVTTGVGHEGDDP